MARIYYCNGETMVYVKGMAGTAIASWQELGLSEKQITIAITTNQEPIMVNAHGSTPAEIQSMGRTATLNISLVNFDTAILDLCLAMAGGVTTASPSGGIQPHAGVRLGGNAALYANGNKYISVSFSSPDAGIPWTFYNCYIAAGGISYPLGNEKSIVPTVWNAISYQQDPWAAGVGLAGQVLYANVLTP